jgi:hypothetical protein
MRDLRVHAEPKWYSNAIALFFYEKAQDGRVSYVSKLVMETVKEGEFVETSDVFTIPHETAQELIDSLWQCGLRPSEGSGSAGSLKATQDHLKELQAITNRLFNMIERKNNE